MRHLVVILALCALPHTAVAGSTAKVQARREEARAEIVRLLGGGNPQSVLSRLKYLDEKRFAAVELMRAWDRIADPERQRDVAFVLAGLGEPVSERLYVEFTTSSDSAIRMNGAIGLGRMRSKQTGALVPLLQDPSMAVRREAARALGQSRVKKMAKVLLRAAKVEGEPEARAVMLEAVGALGDPKSAPALVTHLDASSESTRFAAGRALVQLRHAKGYAFAKSLLASEDRFVRRQGVALFEGVPAKQAAPYLEPMLQDPDRRVAAASARVLYEGGDESKLEWLVVASHLARVDDKRHIEAELERLMLTDDRRKAILKKAGML